MRGGRQQITVTEIPYEVNKAQLVKRINDLRLNKKVEGIAEARDETDRSGLRLAIELKRNADAKGILNYLLKNTDLQINYNFNMVAIDDQRPMRIGLKHYLKSYLAFQQEIITRRTRFDLNKAQTRLHIVEGLIKALSILDQVIKTIRASKNRKDATNNLVTEYQFTQPQAEAIVALQLYRLTNTDVTDLQDEKKRLNDAIDEYEKILNDKNELNRVLVRELKAIDKAFGSERRTQIEKHVQKLTVDTKVTVPDEEVVVLVSHAGYIKRSSLRSFNASSLADNGLREDDYPLLIQSASTLSHLFMFTNLGHVIYRAIHELADTKWKETGEHISQSIGLADNEQIISALIFDHLDVPGTVIISTSDGQVKQTTISDLNPGTRYKSRASVFMKLKNDQAQVLNVQYYEPKDENTSLTAISKQGYGLRFGVAEVPVQGTRTAGVRAINLKDGDELTNLVLTNAQDNLAIITQRGAFKEMAASELELGRRARRGVLVLHKLKRNPHEVVDFIAYSPEFHGALEVITDRPEFQDILVDDHHLGTIKSNGTFVIDTDTQGVPVTLRKKITTVDDKETDLNESTEDAPQHGSKQETLDIN